MPLCHYDVGTLAYESGFGAGGRLTAWAAPVTVQRVAGDHFALGESGGSILATTSTSC